MSKIAGIIREERFPSVVCIKCQNVHGAIQLTNGWHVILADCKSQKLLQKADDLEPIEPCDYCKQSSEVGNHEH